MGSCLKCSETKKKIGGLDESEQEAEKVEMRADKSWRHITQGLWATKKTSDFQFGQDATDLTFSVLPCLQL